MKSLSPQMIGLVRGLGLAAAVGATGAALTYLADEPTGRYWWVPVLAAGLRTVEGILDRLRGQAPQAPGGSRPANPAVYVPVPVGAPSPIAPAPSDPPSTGPDVSDLAP